MSKTIDMTGWDMSERVEGSQIIVIKKASKPTTVKSNQSNAYWTCKCKLCGNIFIANGSDIRRGHTKSCGCHAYNKKDLTGQQFGYLTVLELIPERSANRSCRWLCQCRCGNQVVIRADSLRNGNTTSCGCVKSIGEQRINKILIDANIPFLHDKGYFHDLVSDKGVVLRYDFILFQDNNPTRIIEFDGEQHIHETEFYGGEEYFAKQIKYDNLKNEYARVHNIPLVRIPYQERDHITLDMLLGNKYLIT